MCGIIAGVSKRSITPFLIQGLKQLEYRGYDSSGVGVLKNGKFERERKIGAKNIDALKQETSDNESFNDAHIGVAHTRWATHGGVSVENAHPHCGPLNTIMLVHNGIIENFEELKKHIDEAKLIGQTDTEVLAHYIESLCRDGEALKETLEKVIPHIRGEWNGVVLRNTGECIAIRKSGQSLVCGTSGEGIFVASDEQALPASVVQIYEIPHGNMAEIKEERISFYDSYGKEMKCASRERVVFPVHIIEGEMMAGEIRSQDVTLKALIQGIKNQQDVVKDIFSILNSKEVKEIIFTACGTSFNAGLCVAREWEKVFQKPVQVIIASEMESVTRNLTSAVLVALSQSGSTQDVLGAVAYAKKQGVQKVIAITNKKYSAIREVADILFDVCAGPEFGVAASKTFSHTVLSLLTLSKTISDKDIQMSLPKITQIIKDTDISSKRFASEIQKSSTILYLGKHSLHPVAVEGALKIKEISYIHAEGFAAGELKHGPIALVESGVPVIVLVRHDAAEEAVLGSVREVEARGAVVYCICEEGVHLPTIPEERIIVVPQLGALHQIAFTIPLQLLAYHTAKAKGLDPDKPRNLAKSVTVK
ncbi:MAG: glutamine--fructose-6-phosphate transaminase (isomerizing) [Minisyncoccia bacterium]